LQKFCENRKKAEEIAERSRKNLRSFSNIRKVEKVVERLRKTQKVEKIAEKG
jgi:hypothetical protein